MSAADGNGTGARTAVVGARPVVLLRYRPGVTGETERVVHLMPLPAHGQVGATGVALCGALLCSDQVEVVNPGHGMPCSRCMINHVSTSPAPMPAETRATASPVDDSRRDTRVAACYREWGWSVMLRGDQIWLNLEPEMVALIIPVPLAEQVAEILRRRRCLPLVLVHPDAPEHQVLLVGERYGVALPWPPGVRRATGTLPLPPTMTPRGPVTWVYRPEGDGLRMCREIDVFAALRTVLRDPPS